MSKLELATSEPLASLKEEEKNCQGNVAAHTNKIRGIPWGTFDSNNQPINHITKIVSKGLITAQSKPIAVCLYFTNTSRQARK